MGDALELVIDDQLRDELDKAKHVDCLRESGDDVRVPAAVRAACELLYKSKPGIEQTERTGKALLVSVIQIQTSKLDIQE
jgi:hypothetical protein